MSVSWPIIGNRNKLFNGATEEDDVRTQS